MRIRNSLTLVEIMVAVTVFALLSLALYMLLHTGIDVRKRINNQQDYAQQIYLRLELISREARNIIVFKKKDPEFLAFEGRSNAFKFNALLFDYQASSPVIKNIKYEFSSGNMLKTISGPLNHETEKEFVFIDKISDLAFYYFDESKPEGQKWQDTFQYQADPGNLPRGIKIEMKYLDKTGKEQSINKYIYISKKPEI